MLSSQAIERFRELYLKELGIPLSVDEATEQAQRFLNVARVVMQPMPKRFESRYKEFFYEQKNHGKAG